MCALDFTFNIPSAWSLPENFPSISILLQIISPRTAAVGPITIFPSEVKFPVNIPSNLKSALVMISPVMIVPSTILFVLPNK